MNWVGMIFVVLLAFVTWFGIDCLLTKLVCWAIGELWHPVPFWPMFALVFVIGLLFGGWVKVSKS